MPYYIVYNDILSSLSKYCFTQTMASSILNKSVLLVRPLVSNFSLPALSITMKQKQQIFVHYVKLIATHSLKFSYVHLIAL